MRNSNSYFSFFPFVFHASPPSSATYPTHTSLCVHTCCRSISPLNAQTCPFLSSMNPLPFPRYF